MDGKKMTDMLLRNICNGMADNIGRLEAMTEKLMRDRDEAQAKVTDLERSHGVYKSLQQGLVDERDKARRERDVFGLVACGVGVAWMIEVLVKWVF